ncbi:LmbU family transcriptional regulator [Streptomyces hyaluromycini]|uniref:LmbU family transcriptional regulator n=1 Tax=Streptomyces hyaluromycini TaxID=1377993 RepID=A0ABV1XFJ3_9ACTN
MQQSVDTSAQDSRSSRTGAPLRRPKADGTQRRDILTTRVGLKIPAALTFERWQHVGSQISRIVDSSSWCLGDWLVYGQQEFSDRYLRAIEACGLDYQTLRNYAWVARKFELHRRRETLSFQHHAEVSSLPPCEQDKWLDLAEEFNWSRNELRRNIRAHRQRDSTGGPSEDYLPKLAVPAERVQQWRRAAEVSGDKFEQWVLQALDQAALASLHVTEGARV